MISLKHWTGRVNCHREVEPIERLHSFLMCLYVILVPYCLYLFCILVLPIFPNLKSVIDMPWGIMFKDGYVFAHDGSRVCFACSCRFLKALFLFASFLLQMSCGLCLLIRFDFLFQTQALKTNRICLSKS